jgi:surface carbohydrate biosynthesis protein
MSTVAIPIETKVRELDGKLWLGLHLLARDHSVVLGPAGEVKASLHRTAPDMYISKDLGDGNVDFFDALRAAGCRVCGLPTEGAPGPPSVHTE